MIKYLSVFTFLQPLSFINENECLFNSKNNNSMLDINNNYAGPDVSSEKETPADWHFEFLKINYTTSQCTLSIKQTRHNGS